jgi:hypothetical protein
MDDEIKEIHDRLMDGISTADPEELQVIRKILFEAKEQTVLRYNILSARLWNDIDFKPGDTVYVGDNPESMVVSAILPAFYDPCNGKPTVVVQSQVIPERCYPVSVDLLRRP